MDCVGPHRTYQCGVFLDSIQQSDLEEQEDTWELRKHESYRLE